MDQVTRKHAGTKRFTLKTREKIVALIEKHEERSVTEQSVYRYLYKGEGSDEMALSIERVIPFLGKGVAMNSDLAIIIPDTSNPFFIALWRAIANHVRLLDDCFLEACTVDRNESLENRVINHLISKEVDGVFYLQNPPFDSTLELLDSSPEIGLVLIDSKPPESLPHIASVLTDSDDGIRQAVMHLAMAHHTDVAFLAGPAESEAGQARLLAFNEYASEFELNSVLESQLRGDFTFASGVRAAHELAMLDHRGAALPTAVVCANDEMARGLLKGLMSSGIAVPRQISIIGFDNTEEVQRSAIKIASVDQHVDELAETAVRLMHEQMVRIGLRDNGKQAARREIAPVVIPSEFIYDGRGSVADRSKSSERSDDTANAA